jgi:hypothetical protein
MTPEQQATSVLGPGQRYILLGLLVFTLFFRLATLMMMNTGVDERDYWYSGKAIANGLPYPELSHRTTRFSVILPVALTQLLFGSHPNVYYVMPVLNSLLQVALAFAIGTKLRGRLTGFLAGLGLVLFPYMIRAGSQVRPEIFSMTYMLLVFYFFLEYMQRPEKEIRLLLWTSVCLFVAYESKVTNLFFLPGLLLAILVYKKKLSHAFILAGAVVLLFLAETGAYALLTPYKLGELQIISSHHLWAGNIFTVPRFVDLFNRYASPNLQAYWQVPFVAFAAATVFYLVKRTDSRVSGIGLAALSFFLGITFEVGSLHPITPAESFINRYFCSVLVPVFLVLAYLAEGIVRRALTALKPLSSRHPSRAYLAALVMGAVLVLGVFSLRSLPASMREYANSPLHLERHPLAVNEAYRAQINAALTQGIPVMAVGDGGGENAIMTCASYFVDLSLYQAGKPPQYFESARDDGRTYLELARDGRDIKSEWVLAAVRQPFRVLRIPASDLRRLTDSSVAGR